MIDYYGATSNNIKATRYTADNLKMGEDVTPKRTPADSSKLLSRYSNPKDFDKSFNYLSLIGNLNYMEKGSFSVIEYTNHQCARLYTCPKKEHA